MIIDDVFGYTLKKTCRPPKWESICEHNLELSGKVIKMVIIFSQKAGNILAVNSSIAFLQEW